MLEEVLGLLSADEHTHLRIEPHSDIIGIDQIREITKPLGLKRGSNWLIISISDAHKMTIEAQNFLLKNLEDSLDRQLYVLAADNSASLLPTILSRVKIINYRPPSLKLPDNRQSGFFRASGFSVAALEKYQKGDDRLFTLARNWLSAPTEKRLELITGLKTKTEAAALIEALIVLYYGLLIQQAKKSDKRQLQSVIQSIDLLQETESRLTNNGNVRLNLTQLCLSLR